MLLRSSKPKGKLHVKGFSFFIKDCHILRLLLMWLGISRNSGITWLAAKIVFHNKSLNIFASGLGVSASIAFFPSCDPLISRFHAWGDISPFYLFILVQIKKLKSFLWDSNKPRQTYINTF